MMRILTLLSALLLGLSACKKIEETTPRYPADGCLLCNHFGHTAEGGKCFTCKGAGVCQFCAGKGKRLVGDKQKFYEETCAFCQGGGKCHYCEGSGKCFLCKGTGKYVPLKPAGHDSTSAAGS